MIAFLALAGHALLGGTAGARLLRDARWAQRSPRIGVLAWAVLCGSVVASTLLAGLALAAPAWPLGLPLADLLDTCLVLLRDQYATPGGAAVTTLGLGLTVGVVVRAAWSAGRVCWVARVGRRRHRRHLALVAHLDPALDALVFAHRECAAYALPGRPGRVVLTDATVAALGDRQLRAVLEHERAHLRGRHHLALQAAASLRAAFPFVPAFRWAVADVHRLTEMLADDAALRHGDRAALATALVRLAGSSAPAAALGAGGGTALVRAQRLATPVAPLGGLRSLAALVALAALAALPLAVLAAPALAVVSVDYCPVLLPQ